MATRTGTTIPQQTDAVSIVQEWTGMLQGDDGSWLLLSHYNDKSVHVFGTFGGATVTLQGSNESTPTSGNAVGLNDPTQTTLSFTSKGLKQVLENPLYFRPLVTGGDGTTSLTIRMVCR